MYAPLLPLICSFPTKPFFHPKKSMNLTQRVNTPIGSASGVISGGVARFAVRYASADRWQPATQADVWKMP